MTLRKSLRRLARRVRRLMTRGLSPSSHRTGTEGGIPIPDFSSPRRLAGSKIPSHLIQTAPSRILDVEHFREVSEFRQHNSDLDHTWFDDADINRYMATSWAHHPIKSIFDRALFPQMKSDIFRYCYVFENGGFYLDANKTVRSKLTSLVLPESDGLISYEKNYSVVFPDTDVAPHFDFPQNVVLQWCFGFAPQHAVLDTVIARIVELEPFFVNRVFTRVTSAVVAFTGPGVFTWALRKVAGHPGGLSRISQVGPDFDDRGQLRLKNSEAVFGGRLHYTKYKDRPILSGD